MRSLLLHEVTRLCVLFFIFKQLQAQSWETLHSKHALNYLIFFKTVNNFGILSTCVSVQNV